MNLKEKTIYTSQIYVVFPGSRRSWVKKDIKNKTFYWSVICIKNNSQIIGLELDKCLNMNTSWKQLSGQEIGHHPPPRRHAHTPRQSLTLLRWIIFWLLSLDWFCSQTLNKCQYNVQSFVVGFFLSHYFIYLYVGVEHSFSQLNNIPKNLFLRY